MHTLNTIITHPVHAEITSIEARALTDRIKSTANNLWALLLEAHERQVWQVLGYPSWRDYAKVEFDMSHSYAYRLLDQDRVIRALEQATDSPMGEIVSERVARQIKPHLHVVTSDITERMKDGEEPEIAVMNAISSIDKARRIYAESPKRDDFHNRYVENTVRQVATAAECTLRLDFSALDATCIPEWVDELRQAAREIDKLAARLEREGRR